MLGGREMKAAPEPIGAPLWGSHATAAFGKGVTAVVANLFNVYGDHLMNIDPFIAGSQWRVLSRRFQD